MRHIVAAIGRPTYHWGILSRGVILPTYEEAERLDAPTPSDYDPEASSNFGSTISTPTPTQPVTEPSEEEAQDWEREQAEGE